MPQVIESGVAYLALKAAQKLYGKIPDALKPDEFERVQKSATDRRLGSSLQAAREAFSFADGAIATFDRLAAQRGPSMAPEMLERRQGLQRQIEAARRRLETARKTDDVPGIEAAVKVAVSVRGDLDTLIGSFGPPTLADRGVHPSLEEGARLFFRGDYQQAVASLSSDRFSGDVPLRLHVHLFRAASLFALYARSGGADASLRDQAQAEVNQCRQLDPDFVPDERHFSPQFLAFYRGTAPPIPVRPVPREGK